MEFTVSATETGCHATLQAAVEAARAVPGGGHTIWVKEGFYPNTAVMLDERDNGLAIRAAEGARPVLCGGVEVDGWRREADGLYTAPLPENAPASLRLLMVDGQPRPRARLPQSGALHHQSVFSSNWLSTTAGGWDVKPTPAQLRSLVCRTADLGPGFDWRSAEVTVYHKWDVSHSGLAAYDPATGSMQTSLPLGAPAGSYGYDDYVLYNTADGMQAPGSWRVDKPARRLYYRPLPGETPENLSAFVPVHRHILCLKGPVRGLTLQGLAFCCSWALPVTEGFGAEAVDGAIQGTSLTDSRLQDLSFYALSGWGIRLDGETGGVNITGCNIRDAGAGGILVRAAEPCLIRGNHVQNTGCIHLSAIGISATNSSVCENTLSNLSYSGIVCSGRKHKTRIAGNRVEQAVQALNDGAGIYATFCAGGEMRGNTVCGIPQYGRADSTRNGLYLDEQCENWLVEGNVTVDCSSAMMNHMANGNTLRNNIFANTQGDLLVSFLRCGGYRFSQNTFYASGGVTVAGRAGGAEQWEGNLLYSGKGEHWWTAVAEDYTRAQPVPFSAEAMARP